MLFGSGRDQSMGEAGDEESTHKWRSSTSTQSSSDVGKHSRSDRGQHRADDSAGGLPTSHYESCNRDNHK
jgi:hypothetical protein